MYPVKNTADADINVNFQEKVQEMNDIKKKKRKTQVEKSKLEVAVKLTERPATRNSLRTIVKKRKAEDELLGDNPPKRSKTNAGKKSERRDVEDRSTGVSKHVDIWL
jgi:hypothetical protein